MVKKLTLIFSLIAPQVLVNSEKQKVPDTNQFRYSQTASDDGIVEATQPETQTEDEEQDYSRKRLCR